MTSIPGLLEALAAAPLNSVVPNFWMPLHHLSQVPAPWAWTLRIQRSP
jgi:hypothetical protein